MNSTKPELLRIEESDFEEYLILRSEPHNLEWTGYRSAPDPKSFKIWFDERLNDPSREIFLLKDEKIVIGSLNIDYYSQKAYIGYSTKNGFEGKGYGTLIVKMAIAKIMDSQKDVNTVLAWISEKNLASQKVAEKAGFKKGKFEFRQRLGANEKYFEFVFEVNEK